MILARTWIPYLWIIPLFLASVAATHDEFVAWGFLFFSPYSLIVFVLGYTITLVACHPKPLSLHPIIHFVLFEIATYAGFYGSHRECVSGVIYPLLLIGTALVVISGIVVLFFVRLFFPGKEYLV